MTIRYALLVVFLFVPLIYTYTSFRLLFPSNVVRWSYLSIAIVYLGFLLYALSLERQEMGLMFKNHYWFVIVFVICFGFLLMQLIWMGVGLIDDVRAFIVFGVKKLNHYYSLKRQDVPSATPAPKIVISRSLFLQWLGFGLGSLLFGTLLWGMTNRYNYKKRRIQLSLAGLSSAWKGYKIIQLSDIHCGSFQTSHYEAVKQGIMMVNEEKPDLILFTGDIVNNITAEIEPWKDLFAQLRAKDGVFSTLGNHDYGNYYEWKNPEDKVKNLEDLKQIQKQMGWKLLNNETAFITRPQASDRLAIVGVENWSASSAFPKYGDLKKALLTTKPEDVKILMSHDPSHWDVEVREKHPSIQLMLSGHTHGMQFGLETPFFRWSPVQWIYKQWAGLYKSGNQLLYVNRGFGFLGYPGRVGILPEITVIELV